MQFPLVLVGLGNPGATYDRTRHNIGRDVILDFSKQLSLSWTSFSSGRVAWCSHDLGKTALFYSEDYMNLSGRALQAFCSFYRIPIDRVCVFHDELERRLGVCRMRFGGSERGHNGLRHISQLMGSGYWRFGIGIDHPKRLGLQISVSDYVLARFSSKDCEEMKQTRVKLSEHLDAFVRGDFIFLQQFFQKDK